jgi:hypothetical protein
VLAGTQSLAGARGRSPRLPLPPEWPDQSRIRVLRLRALRLQQDSNFAELVFERHPLVGAKSANTPRLSYAEPFHDLLGADLTHTRH